MNSQSRKEFNEAFVVEYCGLLPEHMHGIDIDAFLKDHHLDKALDAAWNARATSELSDKTFIPDKPKDKESGEKFIDRPQAELSGARLFDNMPGHDEPCYYCNEPCNQLAANPGLWPICLSQSGQSAWHHSKCVKIRLDKREPPAVEPKCPACNEAIDAKWGSIHYCSKTDESWKESGLARFNKPDSDRVAPIELIDYAEFYRAMDTRPAEFIDKLNDVITRLNEHEERLNNPHINWQVQK